MSLAKGTGRADAEHFERLYAESADPWGYCTSAYERTKYADTLAALPARPLGAVLEVGCSIGVFTRQLATRCERVVGLDFSPRALALAATRTNGLTNVTLAQGSFPEEAPSGEWDVVLCSEVLYYLGEDALAQAIDWLSEQLRAGTSIVAVSWRGEGVEEPLRGDDVHDRLAVELARWHSLDARRDGYRLDRFDADGR
jgi:2-polyprenyl-3-methyl-5-hydroxy-6-metoxy-1,4-benzoquinol methylase